MQLSNKKKKERAVDTHNLHESQRLYAEWKKAVSKADTLYDSICMAFLTRQN